MTARFRTKEQAKPAIAAVIETGLVFTLDVQPGLALPYSLTVHDEQAAA